MYRTLTPSRVVNKHTYIHSCIVICIRQNAGVPYESIENSNCMIYSIRSYIWLYGKVRLKFLICILFNMFRPALSKKYDSCKHYFNAEIG